MSRFIDFAAIKKDVSFEAAIKLLGLKAKPEGRNAMGNRTWRADCPACDKERVLFITEKEAYFCHADGKGGDCYRACRPCPRASPPRRGVPSLGSNRHWNWY